MVKTKESNTKFYPFVSVCTPTFNRRPFIETMFQCFLNQTYPKNRIEWIIVDDGTDKIKDLVAKANIPQIKYFEIEKKLYLGEKRNLMHSYCSPKSKYIVYMDDDDYYPPERIEHAVDRLECNPTALCAGSSEIYIYFKHIQKMYQCGPYGPNHATAGTFAFRTELLKITKYDNDAALAEEKSFLKNYTIPFIQLDPLKTILVFSHVHNTFDKKKMLDNQHPQYCKESPKKVSQFIKNNYEEKIKKFFMEDIESLLKKYEPGEPKMKSDVLEQIKKIEKEREELNKQNPNQQQQIMMNRPGMEPVVLNNEQIIQLIQQQQGQIQTMTNQISDKDEIIKKLQKKILDMNHSNKDTTVFQKQTIGISKPNKLVEIKEKSKCEPEIMFDVSD
jgi:glycosyltransferase involved in cell wall biosynthesis